VLELYGLCGNQWGAQKKITEDIKQSYLLRDKTEKTRFEEACLNLLDQREQMKVECLGTTSSLL
jgi:hypothetical protein